MSHWLAGCACCSRASVVCQLLTAPGLPLLLQVTGYLMMGALTPNCKKHSGALAGARLAAAEACSWGEACRKEHTRAARAPPATRANLTLCSPFPLAALHWFVRAVTLFEGGRVYGAEVIAELIEELHAR